MKKIIYTITLCLLAILYFTDYKLNAFFYSIVSKPYYNSNEQINLTPGLYTSNDGKTINRKNLIRDETAAPF